jgi:hypothetical protein
MSSNEDDDLVTITVEFTQYYTAYNFDGNEQPNCMAVNKNDFLGTIYIYYVAEQLFNFPFDVTVNYNNGQKATTGSAKYDGDSDRLIFTPASPICMTAISSISYVQDNSG